MATKTICGRDARAERQSSKGRPGPPGCGGAYLSHHVRDGRRAHYEAVLVLEENPRVDPGLRSKTKGEAGVMDGAARVRAQPR